MEKAIAKPFRLKVLPDIPNRSGFVRRWVVKSNFDQMKNRGWEKVGGTESVIKECREMIAMEIPEKIYNEGRELVRKLTAQREQHVRSKAKNSGIKEDISIRKGGRVVLSEDNEEAD